MRFRTVALCAVALLLVAGACSVTTPRDGYTARAGGTGRATASAAGDELSTSSDVAAGESPLDGAAPVPGALTGQSAGRSLSRTGAAARSSAGTAGVATGSTGPSVPAPQGVINPESTVGVTKDSITISVVASFNGPLAAFTQAVYPGFQTWIEDVNARGGIHGRRIIVKQVGHGDTNDGAVAACKQILSNGSFIAIWIVGDRMDPGMDCTDKAGYPGLTIEAIERSYSHWKRTYNITLYPRTLGELLPSLVRNVMGDAGKKLGVMYSAGGAFEEVKNAYVRAAKAEGMQVVHEEATSQTQASFTSQLLRMRDKGVQNLAILSAFESVGIFRDAQVIGYRPHFTGFGLTIDTFSQACRCEYERGAKALRFWTTVDTPAWARFRETMQKYGRGAQADGNTVFTFGDGLVLEHVLNLAGPTPNRGSLIAGIHTVKAFDATGIVAPLTWGPGRLEGSRSAFAVECCDAGWSWKLLRAPATRF